MAKSEYIAVVDHLTEYEKAFSFIRLENTDKAFAFAEGARKGFALNKPYCVHICKRISKRDIKYMSVGIVYPHGTIRGVEDWADNTKTWQVWDFQFEKKPQFS